MKRPTVAGSQTQDTSGLSCQCSATEPQQPDDHQPSQFSIYTAQVVLNAWVRLPVTAGLFTFLYFHLITSKFIYFQREARCFEQKSFCFIDCYYLDNFFLKPLTSFCSVIYRIVITGEKSHPVVGNGHILHTI